MSVLPNLVRQVTPLPTDLKSVFRGGRALVATIRVKKTEDEKELIAPCEPYGWNHIRYSSHSHHPGDL
jgi:hypothetical protein